MTALTADQEAALEAARHLVTYGVPLFICKPALDDKGEWDPTGGHSGTGYWMPEGWKKTKPSLKVIDRWKPGQALCAVMGVVVDLLDVDPQNNGNDSFKLMKDLGVVPDSYGRALTPSGGFHDFIHTMGVRSRDGLFPGVDIKAGDADGEGRGFAFIAPTRKLSKGGMVETYRWETPPSLEALQMLGLDDGAKALAEAIVERNPTGGEDPYEGPDYTELEEWQQELSDRHFADQLEVWRKRLAEAAEWYDGDRDDYGRGWEALSRDFAWMLATRVHHPAYKIDQEFEAELLFLDVMPDEMLADEMCRDKLNRGRFDAAASEIPFRPFWYEDVSEFDDGDDGEPIAKVVKPTHTYQSVADSYHWIVEQLGRDGTPLAGMFARSGEIVYTPRVRESGYIPPDRTGDDDGPAQIRRVTAGNIAAAVDIGYRVMKVNQASIVRSIFNAQAATRLVDTHPAELKNLRVVRGVTHTPITRADGTIFSNPGYDKATRMLYLPSSQLVIEEIEDTPERAKEFLDEMLEGFPWLTEHDQANYIAALLTPLLRNMITPPYKLIAIGAPQPGSGKSLLAQLLRIVHGGVFRSEFPENKAELRKQITSILDTTSAPVVQWDNVMGTLKSPVLDGLLTSAEWTDRVLGATSDISTPNDRLWVITGNNLRIGGDLARRTLWITIDAQMEHPENRVDFRHEDLAGWATDNRGKILWALLTLINSWVVAGRPTSELKTTDSFGTWVRVTGGIVSHSGWSGVVGHQESVRQKESDDESEWSSFLGAIRSVKGDNFWTAKDVVEMIALEDIDAENVPDLILEKVHRSTGSAAKSLGRWLLFRKDRWFQGYVLRQKQEVNVSKWYIEARN